MHVSLAVDTTATHSWMEPAQRSVCALFNEPQTHNSSGTDLELPTSTRKHHANIERAKVKCPLQPLSVLSTLVFTHVFLMLFPLPSLFPVHLSTMQLGFWRTALEHVCSGWKSLSTGKYLTSMADFKITTLTCMSLDFGRKLKNPESRWIRTQDPLVVSRPSWQIADSHYNINYVVKWCLS